MKLYRVILQGMGYSVGTSPAYGLSYVVADNPAIAYEITKSFLDKNGIGSVSDRTLESITLLADEERYNCKNLLFVQE